MGNNQNLISCSQPFEAFTNSGYCSKLPREAGYERRAKLYELHHHLNHDLLAMWCRSVDRDSLLNITIKICPVMGFKVIFINKWVIGIHSKSRVILDTDIAHNVQHSFEMTLTWVSIVGTQK